MMIGRSLKFAVDHYLNFICDFITGRSQQAKQQSWSCWLDSKYAQDVYLV